MKINLFSILTKKEINSNAAGENQKKLKDIERGEHSTIEYALKDERNARLKKVRDIILRIF